MQEVTDRQTKILKAIIEEYMETGQPIGSEILEKKHGLGVSPATVRNEMVKLTEAGYLRQLHTSAGRTPTKQAFKLYVNSLMQEKDLTVADEVAAKEKVWDSRFNFDDLLQEATRALAERTRALAVASNESGDIFHSGYAHILECPEFYDIDVTRTVLSMLEEANRMQSLFERAFGEGPIHLLLGDELGYDFLEPCGMVFTKFQTGKHHGALGIIGPNRLNYPSVVPVVKYFGRLIEELAGSI